LKDRKVPVQSCRKTKTSEGIIGNTEDIIVNVAGDNIKLSCKHNNNFLSHPRVKTFIKNHEFIIEYNKIKAEFNYDSSRTKNMYNYYEKLCILTSKYIKLDPVKYFKFLYPSQVHIIHNDRICYYFDEIPDPTGLEIDICQGKGNKKGISCYIILKYNNNITFKLRIHNSDGAKAPQKDNPFKWETQII
jgi:hypothetical protein